jgi:hypothetical protein
MSLVALIERWPWLGVRRGPRVPPGATPRRPPSGTCSLRGTASSAPEVVEIQGTKAVFYITGHGLERDLAEKHARLLFGLG